MVITRPPPLTVWKTPAANKNDTAFTGGQRTVRLFLFSDKTEQRKAGGPGKGRRLAKD